MSCKTGIPLLCAAILVCASSLASEYYPEDALKNIEDLDWSRVKMSAAMIRTSWPPLCLANCVGFGRGSKARLEFPLAFLQHLKEKMGGQEVHESFFFVEINNLPDPGTQKLFFDINNTKKTKDGLLYVERSSIHGRVTGHKCTHLYDKKNQYTGEISPIPCSFTLKYVQFENADGSKIAKLYPRKKIEAKKTGDYAYICAGNYVSQPVVPWSTDGRGLWDSDVTLDEPTPQDDSIETEGQDECVLPGGWRLQEIQVLIKLVVNRWTQ